MNTVKVTTLKENNSDISWYVYYIGLPGSNFVVSEENLFNICNYVPVE